MNHKIRPAVQHGDEESSRRPAATMRAAGMVRTAASARAAGVRATATTLHAAVAGLRPAPDAARLGRRSLAERRIVVLWLGACLLVGVILARPAGAEPDIPSVPDAGARPPEAAAVTIPDGAPIGGVGQSGPPVLGALAQQVRTETAAVQTLAEQLKQIDSEVTLARGDVTTKREALEVAQRDTQEKRDKADSVASDAYKAGQALGPLGGYANDIHRLSKVAPALPKQPGGEAAARELARCEEAERAAHQSYEAAQQAETILLGRRNSIKTAYDQRSAALATLLGRDAAARERAEAETDAYERSIGASLNLGAGPDGFEPHPDVKRVLEYAISKLGKPYVFGTEGPNTYDCSGLVWDSYRQVGVRLPRVAKDQYAATTKINVRDLLPGDLVAFGPPGSWAGIGHIGIYLGGGRMIHAPSSGDVVKISVVMWSRFYGATRVLGARKVTPPPAPPPPPPAQPPTQPTPPTTKPPITTKPPSSTPSKSGGTGNATTAPPSASSSGPSATRTP